MATLTTARESAVFPVIEKEGLFVPIIPDEQLIGQFENARIYIELDRASESPDASSPAASSAGYSGAIGGLYISTHRVIWQPTPPDGASASASAAALPLLALGFDVRDLQQHSIAVDLKISRGRLFVCELFPAVMRPADGDDDDDVAAGEATLAGVAKHGEKKAPQPTGASSSAADATAAAGSTDEGKATEAAVPKPLSTEELAAVSTLGMVLPQLPAGFAPKKLMFSLKGGDYFRARRALAEALEETDIRAITQRRHRNPGAMTEAAVAQAFAAAKSCRQIVLGIESDAELEGADGWGADAGGDAEAGEGRDGGAMALAGLGILPASATHPATSPEVAARVAAAAALASSGAGAAGVQSLASQRSGQARARHDLAASSLSGSAVSSAVEAKSLAPAAAAAAAPTAAALTAGVGAGAGAGAGTGAGAGLALPAGLDPALAEMFKRMGFAGKVSFTSPDDT